MVKKIVTQLARADRDEPTETPLAPAMTQHAYNMTYTRGL